MEMRHLKTFTTVVESGGFTRAGAKLGYTQSTITAHIQSLETEIGSPLFDRLGKRVVLTENGQRLLQYAKEILRLSEEAVISSSMEGQPSGTMRIGATESLMVYRLPPVLYEFKKRYPNVQLILQPSENWQLHSKLKSGEVDLSVITDLERVDTDLCVHYLVRETLSLIAPPGHPLTQQSTVDPSDLDGETLLMTEPGSYRDLLEHWLKAERVNTAIIDFWSIEAIKHCVMSGLGLSYLPKIAVEEELERRRLISLPWRHSADFVTTQLAYHKDKWLSPAMIQFIKLIEEHARGWQV
jgi:DNA-binding transcriptional LysR family regulator